MLDTIFLARPPTSRALAQEDLLQYRLGRTDIGTSAWILAHYAGMATTESCSTSVREISASLAIGKPEAVAYSIAFVVNFPDRTCGLKREASADEAYCT